MSPDADFMTNTGNLFSKQARINQFVLFKLGRDVFGVPVEQVDSVQIFDRAYHVPNVPDYVLGVTNLRDKIVTVIHLKQRIGLGEELPEGKGQVIYIDSGHKLIGMLVDNVLTLHSISNSDIKEDIDILSSDIDREFLRGAATLEDDIVILLNLDMVLSEYEIEHISKKKHKKVRRTEDDKKTLSEGQIKELDLMEEADSKSDESSQIDEESKIKTKKPTKKRSRKKKSK
jgi:purine-binding chemotaxis protein CheW